jgi:hypothetical protein
MKSIDLINDILFTLSKIKTINNNTITQIDLLLQSLDDKINKKIKNKNLLYIKTNNKCNLCNRIAFYQNNISKDIYYCWIHSL